MNIKLHNKLQTNNVKISIIKTFSHTHAAHEQIFCSTSNHNTRLSDNIFAYKVMQSWVDSIFSIEK